jgi:hypothetical protein
MLPTDSYGNYIIPTIPLIYDKPNEGVTDATKFKDDGEWFLKWSRYIVNRFYNQPMYDGSNTKGTYYGISDNIREMYRYYYGVHTQSLYNYELGMGGGGIGTPFVPDQRQRTLLDHARGKLYEIVEPVKRAMSVRSLDYNVALKKKELKNKLEVKKLVDPLIKETGVEFIPSGVRNIGDKESDIDAIVNKFRTETEINALRLARGIYYEDNLEEKFLYLTLEQIVGGVSCLITEIKGDRLNLIPIPSSQMIIDDRVVGDYSDNAQVGGYVVFMTPSEIFSRWPHLYEDENKREWIENMAKGIACNGQTLTNAINYYNTSKNIIYWNNKTGEIAVAFTNWLSMSTPDYYQSSEGNVVQLKKNEKYLDNEASFVKGKDKEGIDWKQKWHNCITIGNSVVAEYGYVPYQYTPAGKESPNPPFMYYINTFYHGYFRSMASRIKPISDQIEAASRKVKELMDKASGKVYILFGSKLGLTKEDAPEVFSDLRTIGFTIIEDSGQDGNSIDNKRAVADELDFSLQPEVQEFIKWKILLQQEQDAIMNMPPAVLGMQDNIIGKGVMNQTIVQSQKSFLSLMKGYQNYITKVMRQVINVGKMINADYGQKQFFQTSENGEIEEVYFPRTAKYEEMGFFFESDDAIEEKDRQTLYTYLQAYMQNPTASGAKAIRNIVKLMQFKSYNEGIEYLDKFITEEEGKENQMAQAKIASEQDANESSIMMQKQWEFFMAQYKEDQMNYRKEIEVIQKQSQQQIDNYNNAVELLIKKQESDNKIAATNINGGGGQHQQDNEGQENQQSAPPTQ